MIKNFLVIALRKMNRQKFYSGLNILGLTIGIAGAIFILLWVNDENSYDRFHENADRIYRVYQTFRFDDRHIEQTQTPSVLAQTIREKCPEIKMATNIRGFRGEQLVEVDNKKFNEKGVGIADVYFFEFFSFPLISGNPQTVLSNPNSAVISESTVRKYFGDSLAVGRSIKIFGDEFTITGVFMDMPKQSHFHFDIICSFSTYYRDVKPNWGINSFKTYALLKEGIKPQILSERLDEIARNYLFDSQEEYQKVMDAGNYKKFPVQPLTDIHLKSNLLWEFEANGNSNYVNFFSIIALFILLIAIINYVNLSTARSAERGREIGVRKTLGSSRLSLIRQYLFESVLMCVIALILVLLILPLLMPAFQNLVAKSWLIIPFFSNPSQLFILILIVLLIGLIAGIYPAFVLSSFKPIAIFRNKIGKGVKGLGVRNGLVVFQFFITVLLLVMTIVVQKQMNYTRSKDLGCNVDQVVIIKTYGGIVPKLHILKESLLKNTSVISLSASSSVPGKQFTNIGMGLKGTGINSGTNMYIADADFQKTLQLEMIAGRYFDENISSDGQAVVINESMAKALAVDNLLEKQMMIWVGGTGQEPFRIIGVVKDFHYESFHQPVKNLAIVKLNGTCPWNEEFLSVKIRPNKTDETLNYIQEEWGKILPGIPFEYSFLDSIYEAQYQNEQRTGQVFFLFTLFMIFVACLGLLGMTSFTIDRRTKEIALRKVMGATINQIILLLLSDFMRWTIIATILAWPISYLLMDYWLNQFSYRIGITIWPFLYATILILLITLFTVLFHALKASVKNPVNSLHYE
jgi:putative ABC transport system permease protein